MNNFMKELIEIGKTIIISFMLVLVITMLIKPTTVNGHSMNPTLDNKDYLLMDRVSYKIDTPSKGDVVVFKSQITMENGKQKHLIKRVIGTAGDKIKIADGKVYVNDKEIKENYINGSNTYGNIDTTVPKDSLFVMGDNRLPGQSLDSREDIVGFVKTEDIVGKAFVRLYPFNKITLLD
ncbi:signal peptidase I [Tepidibacter sp. Z1-5]|uniref:signal peptidase I n=1 Tax=Tepidibacter sp. Z1-5 TaxID=3134138 RepID=UPI0030BFA8E7